MKKALFFAALFVAICSCTRVDYTITGDGFLEFVGITEDDDQTKAFIESEGKVHWSDGDIIGVYSDKSTVKPFVREDGTNLFKGTEPVSGTQYVGFFPYSQTAYNEESPNILTFTSPDPVFDGKDLRAPMVAVSSDNALHFRQTCGLIHFCIKADTSYDAFAFFGNDGETVAGTGVVDLSDEDPMLTITSDSLSVIMSAIPGDVSFQNGFDLYVILPPMKFAKGFSLVFYKFGEDDYVEMESFSTEKPVNLERGCSLKYREIDMASNNQPRSKLVINKPKMSYETDPHCDYINLNDLGFSGTFNGIPLKIRYSTIYSTWIDVLDEAGVALIQGNTNTYPRVGSIYVDYCFGLIPVHREYYQITQHSYLYRVDFTSNKGDFPYWANFDTDGKDVLFFTPYPDAHSVVVRYMYRGLYYRMDYISDKESNPYSYEYADDTEFPKLSAEETGTAGTGYKMNDKLTFTWGANRNYVEEDVSYDVFDTMKRGLYRLVRVTFYPLIDVYDPSTLDLSQDYVYDGDGVPVHSNIYLLQTPIVLYNQNDWWHSVWPIGDASPTYEGYNPVLTSNYDGGYDGPGEIIYSNVGWDTLLDDNDSWDIGGVITASGGTPAGGHVTGTAINLYAEYHVGYRGQNDYYRPDKSVEWREANLSIPVDLKDGGPVIDWPIGNIYQPGIPVIKYTDFTWNGYWVDIYEKEGDIVYTKATRGYWYMDITPVSYDYSALQVRGTSSYNDNEYWGAWSSYEYNDLGYSKKLITTGSTTFNGRQDCRLKYPNDTYAYAVNGPWRFSTAGARVEPDPIPVNAPRKFRTRSRRESVPHIPDRMPEAPVPILTDGKPLK